MTVCLCIYLRFEAKYGGRERSLVGLLTRGKLAVAGITNHMSEREGEREPYMGSAQIKTISFFIMGLSVNIVWAFLFKALI